MFFQLFSFNIYIYFVLFFYHSGKVHLSIDGLSIKSSSISSLFPLTDKIMRSVTNEQTIKQAAKSTKFCLIDNVARFFNCSISSIVPLNSFGEINLGNS